MGFFILIIAVSALQFVSTQRDYCAVTCSQYPHVGCPIPTIPTTSSCTSFSAITYTAAERTRLLARHNERRNLVASGQAISTPTSGAASWYLPAATDIRRVVWNDELALLASYNVRQCTIRADACRNTDVYNGQNLYMASYSGGSAASIPTETNIDGAVTAWYNGINSLNSQEIDSFAGANGVGGFSQVVWANTLRIGCAGAKWTDGTWWNYLVVCNYGPGGNYIGSRIYTRGVAGSACGTRDTTYTSLCV